MMDAAMSSGLLLVTLSKFRLALISRNPRAQLTVSICSTRLLSFLIIDVGILGFTRYAPPVILGFQGPSQVNPIFRSNSTKIEIPVINLFLSCYRMAFVNGPLDIQFFVGHVPDIPDGFMVLLILSDRRGINLASLNISHTRSEY